MGENNYLKTFGRWLEQEKNSMTRDEASPKPLGGGGVWVCIPNGLLFSE